MSVDRAPLYFESRLGGLFPANRTAEEAMKEIKGRVRVELKGGIANQRRRALFWICCGIVTGILNDKHNMTLTEADLHDIMRDKFRMYDLIVLPSGDEKKRYWSTSNRAMSEADRAEYLNKCIAVWQVWIGIDPSTIRNEAERLT